MLHIEHLALWVNDLDTARQFYETYFGAVAGERYHNPCTGFSSYFLQFPGGGARLELMHRPNVATREQEPPAETHGWAHVALSLGSENAVDTLTERLRAEGYVVLSNPRRTGDGYYESVVLDSEGNRLELTV